MISTIYVALRLDHRLSSVEKGRNLGVEVLGYTDSIDDGMQFIESVTARDVHGKDWTFDRYGDPFYDPENEDNAPPPEGSPFATWDEDIESDDPQLSRPTSVVASTSVFSDDRVLVRSYKLCRCNAMVSDFVRATTEGDRELARQLMASNISTSHK